MNEYLRDRIMRKLDTLSDERLYQVLDYVDFLESRYAEHAPSPTNVFQRFAETVEDRMRAGRVSTQTIAETMGLMNRAMSVLGGVAAAGASVAKDVKDVYDAAVTTPPRSAGDAKGGSAGTGSPSGTGSANTSREAASAPLKADLPGGRPGSDSQGDASDQAPRKPPTS